MHKLTYSSLLRSIISCQRLLRPFLSRIRSSSTQSPRVCGYSLRTNSTFIPPTPLHISDGCRRECAIRTSAGAGRIVKVASNTLGFRLAGAFQTTLVSEAEDISTYSIPYNDPESDSRYPTIHSQPIIFGFSLPPYYFSYTASIKFVVDMFCQLVSFVCDHQAWYMILTGLPPTDYSLVPVCDSSPSSSFRTYLDGRFSLNSNGPGRGTKTSTETCSVHSVRLPA